MVDDMDLIADEALARPTSRSEWFWIVVTAPSAPYAVNFVGMAVSNLLIISILVMLTTWFVVAIALFPGASVYVYEVAAQHVGSWVIIYPIVYALDWFYLNAFIADRTYIIHRGCFDVWDFILGTWKLVTGLFAGTLRIILIYCIATINTVRIDWTIFADRIGWLDIGYNTFASTVMLVDRHNNPALCAASRLLLSAEPRAYKRRMRASHVRAFDVARPSRVLQGCTSLESLTALLSDLLQDDPAARDRLKRAKCALAWRSIHLLLTVTANPSLVTWNVKQWRKNPISHEAWRQARDKLRARRLATKKARRATVMYAIADAQLNPNNNSSDESPLGGGADYHHHPRVSTRGSHIRFGKAIKGGAKGLLNFAGAGAHGGPTIRASRVYRQVSRRKRATVLDRIDRLEAFLIPDKELEEEQADNDDDDDGDVFVDVKSGDEGGGGTTATSEGEEENGLQKEGPTADKYTSEKNDPNGLEQQQPPGATASEETKDPGGDGIEGEQQQQQQQQQGPPPASEAARLTPRASVRSNGSGDGLLFRGSWAFPASPRSPAKSHRASDGSVRRGSVESSALEDVGDDEIHAIVADAYDLADVLTPFQMGHLRTAFRLLDKDQDGLVSGEDLRFHFQSQGCVITRQEASAIIDSVAVTRKGYYATGDDLDIREVERVGFDFPELLAYLVWRLVDEEPHSIRTGLPSGLRLDAATRAALTRALYVRLRGFDERTCDVDAQVHRPLTPNHLYAHIRRLKLDRGPFGFRHPDMHLLFELIALGHDAGAFADDLQDRVSPQCGPVFTTNTTTTATALNSADTNAKGLDAKDTKNGASSSLSSFSSSTAPTHHPNDPPPVITYAQFNAFMDASLNDADADPYLADLGEVEEKTTPIFELSSIFMDHVHLDDDDADDMKDDGGEEEHEDEDGKGKGGVYPDSPPPPPPADSPGGDDGNPPWNLSSGTIPRGVHFFFEDQSPSPQGPPPSEETPMTARRRRVSFPETV